MRCPSQMILYRRYSARHLTANLPSWYAVAMNEVTYTVHIEPAEEGGFVASFPALPGCQTQGETFEEVIAMAKEALVGFLETMHRHGQPIPEEHPQSRQVGFEFPLSASFAR